MIGKKIVETNPITISEVKDMLEKFSETHELTYEQNLTLDHVDKFSKMDVESSTKLVEELLEIVKKKYAVRITDIMPEDLADLRLIFAKERVPIKKEDLEKILEIVNKYRE
ncbi:MAG: RNA polymerase Rpb4 family protein [Methanobacteriaceae archaeon]|nr:RNA polymerase Rpb4 family protein [Methanobacteriaceae archaeon]